RAGALAGCLWRQTFTALASRATKRPAQNAPPRAPAEKTSQQPIRSVPFPYRHSATRYLSRLARADDPESKNRQMRQRALVRRRKKLTWARMSTPPVSKVSMSSLRGSCRFRLFKDPGHPGHRLGDHLHYVTYLHHRKQLLDIRFAHPDAAVRNIM